MYPLKTYSSMKDIDRVMLKDTTSPTLEMTSEPIVDHTDGGKSILSPLW
jgi:hypothetical protein